MISTDFNQVLGTAVSLAVKTSHAETTVSHVVFILCEAGRLDGWLAKEGVDEKAFKDALLQGLAAAPEFPKGSLHAPEISPALARCIHAAEEVAVSHGHDVFDSRTFFALAVTRQHGAAGDDYVRHLFDRMQKARAASPASGKTEPIQIAAPDSDQDFDFDDPFEDMPAPGDLPQALAPYCTDLVAAARAGMLGEVHGRDDEIDRLCKIFGRRTKNNPMLIGEAGVGKTSIVEAFATWIATGRTPAYLAGCRILSLDVGRLVAGCTLRGELEARFVGLIDALKADRKLILFVDEIHMFLGADSNLAIEAKKMKPALASGELRCIGATTRHEYAQYVEIDPAMVRRFQEVAVEEPGRDAAVEILSKVAESYGAYHEVTYEPIAIEAAVDLSIRYLVGRRLPDKAIDILDEAATLVKGGPNPVVTKREILDVIRTMAKDRYIGNDDPALWDEFGRRLAAMVAGHEAACAEVASVMRRASSHPVGRGGARATIHLAGPKGSGKRHIAKTTADLLGAPFLAIDVDEYEGNSGLWGLVGSKPGYAGYSDGGVLTDFVRSNPMSVVFFDGMDRATQEVRTLISGAASEGFVKDGRGRMVSFRNAVLMLSSEAQRTESFGFARTASVDAAPELKGVSVDRAVRVSDLSPGDARRLVELRMQALSSEYERAGVAVSLDHGVLDAVSASGFARGGKASDVIQAFADMIETELFAAEGPGRHIVGRMVDGKVTFGRVTDDAFAA